MNGMLDKYSSLRILSLGIVLVFTVQCSHKYNSSDLDLSYYQWNMWAGDDNSEQAGSHDPLPPSCGWEEFNRGVGKLVRIPATFESQYPEQTGDVLWYHCRFTLPELWEARTISLYFEEAGPQVDLYLNEQLVASKLGATSPFEVDLTGQVYYVRDNHLAIRVSTPEPETDPEAFGILGKVIIKSSASENEPDH